jgi:hypothetical protein
VTPSRDALLLLLADQRIHVGGLVERVPNAQLAQPLDDLMEDVVVHGGDPASRSVNRLAPRSQT